MPRPEQTRAQEAGFVSRCCLSALQDRLPLCWPTAAHTPPSPKKRYRSRYAYLGWHSVSDAAQWETMSEFDLLLRLVDFSGLGDVLTQQLGWVSAQVQVPYDPISMFLMTMWQVFNGWSRAETLRILARPRYAIKVMLS